MPDSSRDDWRDHLRPRLAGLRLSPTREAEIVEELSQHLDERYEELRAGGAGDAEARRLAIEELREPGALADHMRSLGQARAPSPITPGTAWMLRARTWKRGSNASPKRCSRAEPWSRRASMTYGAAWTAPFPTPPRCASLRTPMARRSSTWTLLCPAPRRGDRTAARVARCRSSESTSVSASAASRSRV